MTHGFNLLLTLVVDRVLYPVLYCV